MRTIEELLNTIFAKETLNFETVFSNNDSLFFGIPISDYWKLSGEEKVLAEEKYSQDSSLYISTRNTCKTYELIDKCFIGSLEHGLYHEAYLSRDLELLKKYRDDLARQIDTLKNALKNEFQRNNRAFSPSGIIESVSNRNVCIYMNFVGNKDSDMTDVNTSVGQCLLNKFLRYTSITVESLPKNGHLPVLINKQNLKGITQNFVNLLKNHYNSIEEINKAIIEEIKSEMKLSHPEWWDSQNEQFNVPINSEEGNKAKAEFLERLSRLADLGIGINLNEVAELLKTEYIIESLEDVFPNLVHFLASKLKDDDIFYRMSGENYPNISSNAVLSDVECYPVHYLQSIFTAIMMNNKDESKEDREIIFNNILMIIDKLKRNAIGSINFTKFDEYLIKEIITNAGVEYIERIKKIARPLYYILNDADHVTQVEFLILNKQRTAQDGFFATNSGRFILPLGKICEILGLTECSNILDLIESQSWKGKEVREQDLYLEGDFSRRIEIERSVKTCIRDINGFKDVLISEKFEDTEKENIIEYVSSLGNGPIKSSYDLRYIIESCDKYKSVLLSKFSHVISTSIEQAAMYSHNNDVHTLLTLALRQENNRGPTGIAEMLINRGADINAAPDYGQTDLMNAAMYGNTEIVQNLLERGADINVHDNYGQTAYEYAVMHGHRDIARMLIDRSTDINVHNAQNAYNAHIVQNPPNAPLNRIAVHPAVPDAPPNIPPRAGIVHMLGRIIVNFIQRILYGQDRDPHSV